MIVNEDVGKKDEGRRTKDQGRVSLMKLGKKDQGRRIVNGAKAFFEAACFFNTSLFFQNITNLY